MKMFKGQVEWENSYRLDVVKGRYFYVYDKNENKVYYEDSYGYWIKREYDNQDNEIYYQSSSGKIIDKRTVELTLEQIADKFGVKVENLKIKK